MHKFAHMADVHLGAHREPALKELEMSAFDQAMQRAVDEGVDFILISGDLFHVGIPDLSVVNSALRKMVEVQESGVSIYAIYGSHDYTPTGTSIIDIIETAGAITNLSKWKVQDGRLRLKVTVDGKTGAKLTGISARKVGLESKHYEILDRKTLEEEEGFKVFAFHSGITEFRPESLREMDTLSLSALPSGFDYYAGGHIHERGEFSAKGYRKVVFPGPLFTGYGRDVEDTARGEKRGFYVVEFKDGLEGVSFTSIDTFAGAYFELDVGGKNVAQVNEELRRGLEAVDATDKVVVIRVQGVLVGGRAADIDFAGVRRRLDERGALFVYLNRYGVSSRETPSRAAPGEDVAAIERRMFEKEVSRLKMSRAALTGERGARTAGELLRALRQHARTMELKREYRRRLVSDGISILGLKEVTEGEE